jgi:hypothetical protein
MKVWLDDVRDPGQWLPSIGWFRSGNIGDADEWVWVKSAPEAVAMLEGGTAEEISLDHDLGDRPEAGDGYDVLLWVEERVATDPSYRPPTFHVHTSNPVARDRMEAAVSAIEAMVATRSRSGG